MMGYLLAENLPTRKKKKRKKEQRKLVGGGCSGRI